jgi:hypothetical protein
MFAGTWMCQHQAGVLVLCACWRGHTSEEPSQHWCPSSAAVVCFERLVMCQQLREPCCVVYVGSAGGQCQAGVAVVVTVRIVLQGHECANTKQVNGCYVRVGWDTPERL